MNFFNLNLDIDKYFCFNSNPIFIIPHDLYDFTYIKKDNSIFLDEIKEISSKKNSINEQNNTLENLRILSFLTVNWKNGIKKTLYSSRKKILKQLGIKNE